MTRSRRLVPLATALLLGLLIVLLVPQTQNVIPRARASNRSVALIGSTSGWNFSQPSGTNPRITVNQGDVVTITLTSVDTTHQFAFDADKDGTSFIGMCPTGDTCSTNFSPGSGTSVMITATSQGTFTYFCTFHSSMVGSFVVQAPSSPNFGISPNPTSVAFAQGSSATSTITVTSQNGFSGTISLSSTISPNGPGTSLNPTSVTLSSGTSKSSILSVNSTQTTPPGSYTVSVTATNGTLPHTTMISVSISTPFVPDFGISSSPTGLNFTQGSPGTATITITSLKGFSGTVSLTGQVSPSGPSLSLNPASVTLSGTNAMSTLTVSAAGGLYTPVSNGNYVVNVTGTSGSLAHSTKVQVTVGPSNPSGSTASSLPLTLLIGAGVVILAAILATVFLIRRKR